MTLRNCGTTDSGECGGGHSDPAPHPDQPMKLNPWDKLGWFGRKLNGTTIKKLEELQKQVRDMWINTHRQRS